MYVASNTTGNKGGRPKAELKYDMALVKDLASIFCTQQEIANIMGVSVRTLQRNAEFCHIYAIGIDNAKSNLRRAQMKLALSGNASMLMWLGKQYLNQREPLMDNSIPADEVESDMESYEG